MPSAVVGHRELHQTQQRAVAPLAHELGVERQSPCATLRARARPTPRARLLSRRPVRVLPRFAVGRVNSSLSARAGQSQREACTGRSASSSAVQPAPASRPCGSPARARSPGPSPKPPARRWCCRAGSARRSSSRSAAGTPGPSVAHAHRAQPLSAAASVISTLESWGAIAQGVVEQDAHDPRDRARVGLRPARPAGGLTARRAPRARRRVELELGGHRAAELAQLERLAAQRRPRRPDG